MQIGLISDSHGYLGDDCLKALSDCDEIWHAGDFGTMETVETLQKIAPLRGVYGNVDGREIRQLFPEDMIFEVQGLKVWIRHIGGYPGKYPKEVRQQLSAAPPDLYITGHSHILKIMPDKKLNLLHLNPGAVGKTGFHHLRTLIKFDINNKKIENMQVVELGKRA